MSDACARALLILTSAWLSLTTVGQTCSGNKPGEDCLAGKCCTDKSLKCYEKDQYWAACSDSCTPGISPNDPPEYQTPWTCKVLGDGGDGGGGGATEPPKVDSRRRTFKVPDGRRRRRSKVKDAPKGSVVARHGHLKAKGNRIVDKNDKPVRLRGMSLFWSQWKPQYYTEDVVKWLQKDWKATLVRAAMAVEDSGGYITSPDDEKKKVEVVVDAAIAVGIYVIIDWHSHYAEENLQASQRFFDEMAEKYGQYPNVLFETYNEPKKQGWDDVIKPYHEAVIPFIRHHSPNLVICGTRTWSQEVDVAGLRPVKGDNLAYTLHFYSSSADHQDPLRRRAKAALAHGVPLFVTEWGTCEYTGDGKVDLAQTQKWLDFLDEHYISDANWAIGDKAEACAALIPGTDRKGEGGWKVSELTKSGWFMRESMRKAAGAPDETDPSRRRSPARRRSTPTPPEGTDPSRRRSPRRRSSSRELDEAKADLEEARKEVERLEKRVAELSRGSPRRRKTRRRSR